MAVGGAGFETGAGVGAVAVVGVSGFAVEAVVVAGGGATACDGALVFVVGWAGGFAGAGRSDGVLAVDVGALAVDVVDTVVDADAVIVVEPEPVDLERSLVDPAVEVLPTGRFYRVVTKEGATVTGRLLNLDTFTVQMIDTKEQLRSFTKTNLKEFGFIPTPMPSFKSTFNTQELADVVSYLVSLKGRATP